MTRMRMAVLWLGTLLLLVAGAVQAQSDYKIGFVNVQLILQNAPQIPTINNQLRDEFASRVSQLEGMQEEFTEKRDTYERDREVMGESERVALERELNQLGRDLERRDAELQEDVQLRQQELLNELQVELVQQVRAYADEEGFDLVVTEAIFASAAVDITAAVYDVISEAAGVTPPAESTTDE